MLLSLKERMVKPLTLGKRIKKVRQNADLTQQEFGKRIGIKPNSISLIESGNRNASEQVILSICREFGVNKEWLRTGNGEIFEPTPTSALDALAKEQHLTHGDYIFIEKLLRVGSKNRQAVMEFMLEFAKDILDSEIPVDIPAFPDGEIDPIVFAEIGAGSHREESVADSEALYESYVSPISGSTTVEQEQFQPEQQKMPTPIFEDEQDDLEEFVRKHKKNLTAGQEQQILEMMQAMIAPQKQPLSASVQLTVDEKASKK